MMEHFNQLTPAQAERLAMLAEECGEVIQVIGKILRHGMESYHPAHPEISNAKLLEKELMDLFGVATALDLAGDLELLDGPHSKTAEAAWHGKLKWTHHQFDGHQVNPGTYTGPDGAVIKVEKL